MTSAFFLCLAWAAAGITRQQNANTWLFFGICLKLNLKKKRGRQFFQHEIGFTSLPEQQEGLTVLKSSLYPCPLHNTGICVCKMDLSSAERGKKINVLEIVWQNSAFGTYAVLLITLRHRNLHNVKFTCTYWVLKYHPPRALLARCCAWCEGWDAQLPSIFDVLRQNL